MSKRINIVDMVVGENYANIYLLKSHSLKKTKTGTEYLDLIFMDKTGELPGKLWTIPPALNVDNIQDSDFIVLQFTVEDYQGSKQAKITNIRMVKPTDSFNKEELIPVAPEDPRALFEEIMITAESFSNSDLKKVVKTALQEHKDYFLEVPGAKSVHHAFIGGLAYHTCGMLRTAKALCSVYPIIKSELLYSGVILHDIAKIKEFQTGPVGLVTDYTTEGKLLGHVFMGAKYIGDLCEKLDVNHEIATLLQHMILSHHGIPEHGSAITPMMLEAEMLHICDRIDSRVEIYKEAVKDIEPGEFSGRIFALDNKNIYNPVYSESKTSTEIEEEKDLY